jgi:hypothetical protein
MQLTDRLLVEVALLLIALTKISLTKSGFDHPSVKESPLRLRAQVHAALRGPLHPHFPCPFARVDLSL